MLYGGPLGTYLSGYHASGSAKNGSPSFTSTGSGSSSSSGLNRSSRYRAPSAGRANFYTPQARRKYSDDGAESSSNNRSRYTPTTGNPVNSNSSASGTGPSTATANASEAPAPSSLRAVTLSQYSPKFRRAHSQATSRWLQDGNIYPMQGHPNELVESSLLDYKRLYEAERQDTLELRAQIDQAQQELRESRARVEDARRLQLHQQQQQQQKPTAQWQHVNKTDQRILEELRASSEKLKAEHRALTRVISRLM